jgi:hypothetical protein
LFNRLWQNLTDTEIVPEAISDVVVDFIVRLREQMDGDGGATLADPIHDEFLLLLCDRATARFNASQGEEFVAIRPADLPSLKEAKRAGLPDAILKEVGDRLARISGDRVTANHAPKHEQLA